MKPSGVSERKLSQVICRKSIRARFARVLKVLDELDFSCFAFAFERIQSSKVVYDTFMFQKRFHAEPV